MDRGNWRGLECVSVRLCADLWWSRVVGVWRGGGRCCFLFGAMLVGVVAGQGQERLVTAPPGSTLKVESHLVETTVSVRDRAGQPVTGLSKDVFEVAEDGVPQTVRYFATQRELPLSIGLIVDASDSQSKFMKAHEQAVRAFLREVLEPNDRAFAVCFGNHLRLVTDWTGSADQVMDGLHRFNKGDRSFPEVGPVEDRELGTALFDAIYFPVTERLHQTANRRKVLLVLSDGEDNSSEHDLLDAIREGQNGDVLVYAIRMTEAKPGHMDARDRYGVRVLEHLTEETGGRVYDARTTRLEDDFAEIARDLRSLYELGYYSTNHAHDGGFRKVNISVAMEGLRVRARSGYMAR